jgi:ABC-type nickel/cobalt efflux system permease component RcnA
LRRLAAAVTRVLGDDSLAESKPAPPPDPEPPRPKPRRKAVVAVAKPASSAADLAQAKSGASAAARHVPDGHENLLHLLLDTRTGFAMLLLAAVGLGAAHALTPGHGKTLVAAYLVGERGTVWHALLLGLVTTLTHTGVVLALAAVGYFYPDVVPGAVRATQLVGGLAIALLGCWLLLRRLSGQADHFHLSGHGHHHHHHGHGHSHIHELPAVKPGAGVGWWHLVVLGMQGGIVPCWDAIFILSVAWTTGRLPRALPLLLAFSAGLAAVLIGLGVSVVAARRWVGAHWGSHPRLRRLAGALPLLSAVVILGMGLWLCYDSVHASEMSANGGAVQRPIK